MTSSPQRVIGRTEPFPGNVDMPESVGRATHIAVTRPVVLLGVDLVAPGDPLAEQAEVVVRAGRVHREQPGADVEQLLADLLRLLVTDGDRTLDLARVAA